MLRDVEEVSSGEVKHLWINKVITCFFSVAHGPLVGHTISFKLGSGDHSSDSEARFKTKPRHISRVGSSPKLLSSSRPTASPRHFRTRETDAVDRVN